MNLSMDSSVTTNNGGATQSQEDYSPVPNMGRRLPENSHNYNDRGELTPSVTPAPDQRRQHSNDNDHSSQSQSQAQSQEEDEEWLIYCRCESGKTLLTLLSCLQHVAESPSDTTTPAISATQSSTRARSKSTIQPVTVFCSQTGFNFHVFGPAKQSEASCELQKTLFSQYQVKQDETQTEDWHAGEEFCVNLTSVLEALQMLGSLDDTTRTSVGLSYNINSEIFKIELLQDAPGVLCTCAIPGLMAPADDPDGDSLSNAFRRSPVAARMMVRSGILRDLLPEWSSVAGASCASVAVSAKRGLELAVLGHYGECYVRVPATGDHLVSPLELANDKKNVTRTYPLHSLLSSMKGLELAEETCININSEGIMAIQHKTTDPTGQGASNFVDFIMTCLEDEDDENDEGETTTADASTRASASQRTRLSTTSSQQSPETATTDKRRRRKRRPRSSPSQDSSRTGSRTDTVNEDVDVVEQGSSSDTEGDQGTPSERQKRQAIQKRQQEEANDSSSSDEETQPSISARPLFGSLAVVSNSNKLSQGSGSEAPQPRRRRSVSRPPRRQKRAKQKSTGGESDVSKNMLASSDEEDESEDEEVVRVTTSGSRHHHSRDDECSSPELVYGKQM